MYVWGDNDAKYQSAVARIEGAGYVVLCPYAAANISKKSTARIEQQSEYYLSCEEAWEQADAIYPVVYEAKIASWASSYKVKIITEL